uniref:Protein krueppel n=1 Tax=Glossina brevipalpis TaxID=37001 RepID=A0A1A9X381_9MUSC
MIDEETRVVVCRACICECTEYKSLHKQGILLEEVTTLATLLNFCIGLEIHEEENPQLPQYVCNACVQDLARCYVFKKKVLETNHLLYSHCLEDVEESEDEQNSYEKCKENENTANDKLDICNVDSKERCFNYEDELTSDGQMCEREGNEDFVALSVVSDQNLPDDGENPERDEEGRKFSVDGEIIVEENNADLEYVVHNVAETTEIYLQKSDEEDIQEECEQTEQMYEMHEEDPEEFEIQITDFDSYTEVMTEEVKDDINDESEDKSDSEVILEVDTDADPNMKVYKPRKNTGLRREPNPEYQCKTCGKQLSNSSSFKYHMQLHSDVTPYLCNLCAKRHILVHTAEKPFSCELCGKLFKRQATLRSHQQSHHQLIEARGPSPRRNKSNVIRLKQNQENQAKDNLKERRIQKGSLPPIAKRSLLL